MPKQLHLFEENLPDEEKPAPNSRRLILELLKIRNELLGKEFVTLINDAIERIRALDRASSPGAEEMILEAIEKKQAGTLNEIVGDTRLDRAKTKEILEDLQRRKIVRFVRRKSDNKLLIKSNRI